MLFAKRKHRVDEQEQFWRVCGSFLFQKKGGITKACPAPDNGAGVNKTSRPFVCIFNMGKEMGSFLFPKKLVILKRRDMLPKNRNNLRNGKLFKGVKIIEEEPFRKEYERAARKKNKSNSPAVIVSCIFCQRSAIETEKGYICPKCGQKPLKGIDLIKGYFTCRCGLLVDHRSKVCQGCRSHNNPFKRRGA